MTGPLTPPPTSDKEIQDAAAEAATSEQSAMNIEQTSVKTSPAPPPAVIQTSYELLFPTLASLAVERRYKELIQTAERGDLATGQEKHQSRLLLTAPLVLSYLIIDDLSPARFALNRLPNNLEVLPLSRALLRLVAAAWERKYDLVHSHAEEFRSYLLQSSTLNPNFANVQAALVSEFIDAFRSKTFLLLSKAYTAIPIPLAQTYLRLEKQQLVNAAVTYGWSYDSAADVLTPVKLNTSTTFATGSSTLQTFQFVADGVATAEG